jgi:hypothetical protein
MVTVQESRISMTDRKEKEEALNKGIEKQSA